MGSIFFVYLLFYATINYTYSLLLSLVFSIIYKYLYREMVGKLWPFLEKNIFLTIYHTTYVSMDVMIIIIIV